MERPAKGFLEMLDNTIDICTFSQIRHLVQEARDTIHACNRQIITQEARLETRDLLDKALELIVEAMAEKSISGEKQCSKN